MVAHPLFYYFPKNQLWPCARWWASGPRTIYISSDIWMAEVRARACPIVVFIRAREPWSMTVDLWHKCPMKSLEWLCPEPVSIIGDRIKTGDQSDLVALYRYDLVALYRYDLVVLTRRNYVNQKYQQVAEFNAKTRGPAAPPPPFGYATDFR